MPPENHRDLYNGSPRTIVPAHTLIPTGGKRMRPEAWGPLADAAQASSCAMLQVIGGDVAVYPAAKGASSSLSASPHHLADEDADLREPGWHAREDGLVDLALAAPLGFIPVQIARMLEAIDADVSVGDSGRIVIHALEEGVAEQVAKVFAPLGMVFDSESPALRVSSCVGALACPLALSDVLGDAARLAAQENPKGKVHVAGCEHRCGAPVEPHTEYVATGDGEYEVESV